MKTELALEKHDYDLEGRFPPWFSSIERGRTTFSLIENEEIFDKEGFKTLTHSRKFF